MSNFLGEMRFLHYLTGDLTSFPICKIRSDTFEIQLLQSVYFLLFSLK